MLNRIRYFLLLLTMFASLASANSSFDFSAEPVTNNGKPWRVGYLEGGEYIYYQLIFKASVEAMMRRGWLEEQPIPEQQGEQTADFWRWLSEEASNEYITFVADAHYSAGWSEEQRQSIQQQLLQRLNQQQDIDLMIATGTWAGLDLANSRHQTNTVVISTSDPLSAGIIRSIDDSGFNHLHATVDPEKYSRQVRVFHDLVGFKRLGIAYEDTESGRSYAALGDAEKLARQRGFEIISCHTKSDITDISLAEASVVDCIRDLATKVDAIYLTSQGGVNENTLPTLVQILNQYRVPTFSQNGGEEVRQGILMSISEAGFKYVGEFHAMTLAKIFNGAKPNQLTQLFKEPIRMAVNLKSAELVGYQPPLLLLGASDEIYQSIP